MHRFWDSLHPICHTAALLCWELLVFRDCQLHRLIKMMPNAFFSFVLGRRKKTVLRIMFSLVFQVGWSLHHPVEKDLNHALVQSLLMIVAGELKPLAVIDRNLILLLWGQSLTLIDTRFSPFLDCLRVQDMMEIMENQIYHLLLLSIMFQALLQLQIGNLCRTHFKLTRLFLWIHYLWKSMVVTELQYELALRWFTHFLLLTFTTSIDFMPCLTLTQCQILYYQIINAFDVKSKSKFFFLFLPDTFSCRRNSWGM